MHRTFLTSSGFQAATKCFLSLSIVAVFLCPLAAQANFADDMREYLAGAAVSIALQCGIPLQLNAAGVQQATCVSSGLSSDIQACANSTQDAAGASTCINGVIEKNAGILDSCIPGITSAQKACAVKGAQAAVSGAVQAVQNQIDGAGAGPAGTSVAGGSSGFIPLTSVPAFKEITGQGGLSGFLNQLYILCVGAAAVIAVIQLVRAGMLYSLGDSFTEKKEAKHLITMSLFGLVLVLSPTIVFGIINPAILELRVDTTALAPENPIGIGEQGSPGSGTIGGTGNLIKNKYGAYDEMCHFEVQPFSFTVFETQESLEDLGVGDSNPERGRECCQVLGASIRPGGNGSEVCDYKQALIDTDRWVIRLTAKADLVIAKPDGTRPTENQEITIYSTGTVARNPAPDFDVVALHGFRSFSACEKFVRSGAANILAGIKKPETYNVLQVQLGHAGSFRELDPTEFQYIQKITEVEIENINEICRKIEYAS